MSMAAFLFQVFDGCSTHNCADAQVSITSMKSSGMYNLLSIPSFTGHTNDVVLVPGNVVVVHFSPVESELCTPVVGTDESVVVTSANSRKHVFNI
jgi:hypothetical protein